MDFTEVAGFLVSAGEATRATVHTPDGRSYPELLVEGDFWGWLPETAHPTLTAYADDGTVVGEVTLN